MAKKKNMTKAQVKAFMVELVDTKAEGHGSRDVAQSCRWLEKAASLYGRRRVEALLRSQDRDGGFGEGALWVEYWRRWRAHRDRHLIPRVLVTDPFFVPDQIAQHLVFAPRVEQVEGPQVVAA